MLKYTGHPLYDVGVATICAFVHKQDPSLITEEDLDEVATHIEENYSRDPLKSFLGVAFTTNAWFNQPAFDKQPEKRHDYAERLLQSYRLDDETSVERCVFTGSFVTSTAFSDNLPPGRAFRQHIPLLTGEGVMNFHPDGLAGLPVSGVAALCLQAFPMGCAKCGGKLLAVHSDNPDITYHFAQEFLRQNEKLILLARERGDKKMPESKRTAKTMLVDTFLEIERKRKLESENQRPASVTAYHLTNSGQSNPLDEQNPPLSLYHLPLELTGFLSKVTGHDHYRRQWNAIVAKAWQLPPSSKKMKGKENLEDSRPRRNYLYEDIFRLPDSASNFIRHYFLRLPARKSSEEDPKRSYSLKQEGDLVSWSLTALFLREVVRMEKERLEQIRAFGERLAAYIKAENDRKFFEKFYKETKDYRYLRNTLIKTSLSCIKKGMPPLIDLDMYIAVFEESDDTVRSDWRLARDLVLIKVIEDLYKLNWLSNNADLIDDSEAQEQEGE